MRVLNFLILLVFVGCASSTFIYEGKRDVFRHTQWVDMAAGNYQMNCVWEKVDWETYWGDNLYYNCEQTKEE